MKPAVTVCLGYGVDSTAMLIEMHRRGERPDFISFADTGGETDATYAFIPIFSQWLRDHGFPEPVTCVYQPKEVTASRYRAAVVATAKRLGISLKPLQLDRLSRLYGNMVANDTLPGIAFGPHSCSLKWKLAAQEPH